MFGRIGFFEILVIAIIGLFVIGPDKLPGVARTMGKMVGSARRYVKDLSDEVKVDIEAVTKDIKESEREMKLVLSDPVREKTAAVQPDDTDNINQQEV